MKNPLRSNKRVIAKAQAVGVLALPLTAFNPVNKDAKGLSTCNISERARERTISAVIQASLYNSNMV